MHVVGLAVCRGWRCVRGAASHSDTYALMSASASCHRKRGDPRYLEHMIVAAAACGQRGGFELAQCECDLLPASVAWGDAASAVDVGIGQRLGDVGPSVAHPRSYTPARGRMGGGARSVGQRLRCLASYIPSCCCDGQGSLEWGCFSAASSAVAWVRHGRTCGAQRWVYEALRGSRDWPARSASQQSR